MRREFPSGIPVHFKINFKFKKTIFSEKSYKREKTVKVSNYLSEILIGDNLDQEQKYLVTSTVTLQTRILDKTTWELIKNGEGQQFSADILRDLEKTRILSEIQEERESFQQQDEEEFSDSMDREINLSSNEMPASLADFSENIFAELEKKGKTLLNIYWNHFDSVEARERFINLSNLLIETAKRKKLFCQGLIETTNPDHLLSFIDLHEKHYITSVEIHLKANVNEADFLKAVSTIQEGFKKGEFPLNCRIVLDIGRPEEMNLVIPLIKRLQSCKIHNYASLILVLNEETHAWTRDEKMEYAQKEVEWLIEMNHLGFGLPPIRSVSKAKLASLPESSLLSELSKKNTLHCLNCQILPLCGGHWEEQKDNLIPCPSLKYNLQEKILLKYVLQGSKSVDL